VWTSKRAISLHVALGIFVPGCVALTWWQASRALGGNTLSWVYTFEWPFFGAYAVFMWWKLVHDEPVGRARDEPLGPPPHEPVDGDEVPPDEEAGAGPVGEEDEELAEYNRYLARLNASGRQKRW